MKKGALRPLGMWDPKGLSGLSTTPPPNAFTQPRGLKVLAATRVFPKQSGRAETQKSKKRMGVTGRSSPHRVAPPVEPFPERSHSPLQIRRKSGYSSYKAKVGPPPRPDFTYCAESVSAFFWFLGRGAAGSKWPHLRPTRGGELPMKVAPH